MDGPIRGLIFLVGQKLAQARADVLEALAIFAARIGECVLETAPADIFGNGLLLFMRGKPAFAIKLLDDLDRFDVVARLDGGRAAFV